MKVAIILPVSDSMPHLKPMIEALYESTHFPFRLIIIESGSKDGTKQYVDKLFEEKDNVEVYHTAKRGLVKAINYGIKAAGDLDIYLTQDDVIHFKMYGRDWLEDMWKVSQDSKIGVITGLGGFGISGPDFIDGLRWIGTWNAYIPRRIIKKIGLFDEEFGPGDDVDYSYRVLNAGYSLAVVDYWVHHHRLTEHGDSDNSKKITKMGKKFRKKYKLDEYNESSNNQST